MDQPHLQIFNVHDDEELFGHSIHDYKLKPGLRQWPLQIGMLNVYFRPRSNDATLERINSEINLTFQGSRPGPEDMFVTVGEAATVKWHLD